MFLVELRQEDDTMIITDTLQDTVLKLLVDTKIKSGVIIQHITQDDALQHCK